MNSTQLEEQYVRFSASIHFLDPSKYDEERSIDFDLKPYATALRVLEETKELSIETLSELLRDSPEAVDLFELILQNSNFTTTQRAFLMFDLSRLNSSILEEALEYVLEVLSEDAMIRESFTKSGLFSSAANTNIAQLNDEQKRILLSESKKLIAGVCEKKDTTLLRNRITVSRAARTRAARYLIEKRALPKVLAGIRPSIFLENKRVPVDSKSAHGKYATDILESTLSNHGFRNRDDISQQIPRNNGYQQLLTDSSDMFFYCREREVESASLPGVSISSESATAGKRTAKRFDFVLLYGNRPRVVIETNFYTTGGTKIGINEKEYLAFRQQLTRTEKDLRFIWVTDGSYWLTKPGRNDFLKLAPAFRQDMMNLRMFSEKLPDIKEFIRRPTL